tara:strand:+ start:25 stop:2034 length:2010 start_codon:yes stop_codon:yes gene_type:complete
MISYIRYTGETGFGAGTGGGGSVTLASADTNVSNMIGGTAQTMTTTSFEFDGEVYINNYLGVRPGYKLSFGNPGSSLAAIEGNTSSNGNLYFQTNGSYRMYINPSGNVGIGTTTPYAKLQISGTSTDPTTSTLSSTSSQGILRLHGTGGVFMDLGFQTSSPYAGWIQTHNGTQDATGDDLLLQPVSGNVGIGITSSPSATLDIAQNSQANYSCLRGRGRMMLLPPDGTRSTEIGAFLYLYGENFSNPQKRTSDITKIKQSHIAISTSYTDNTRGYITFQTNNNPDEGPASYIGGINYMNNNFPGALVFGTRHEISGVANRNGAPTERMRIDRQGNVGIGTTNPGAPLEIYKKGWNADEKGGAIILSRFVVGEDGATSSQPYRGSCIWHEYNGNDCMMFASSSNANPYTLSPSMVLTNQGNVGIGTDSPDRPLEIKTDEQASIQLHTATGGDYARIGINTQFSIGEMNGGDIPWASGRSQMNSFFIEYSGGESNWNNEGAYLWMNGDYTGFANTGDANANGGVLHYYDSDLAPTGQGNGTWYINYDGSITNNSDIRLKENIRYFDDEYNISNIKEKYSQIKFCKYNYKKPLKDPSGVKRDYYGIIAQELELLFPETICQDNKGIRSFKNNVLQCITSHITANLIKENQELKTEVATLKTELAVIKQHLGI